MADYMGCEGCNCLLRVEDGPLCASCKQIDKLVADAGTAVDKAAAKVLSAPVVEPEPS